jgi:hypothetical protein
MFAVVDSGQEKLSEEEEKRKEEEFNKRILNSLLRNKLSLLEDLSHKYKLTTKEVVQRIKKFEEDGQVSGVFDERGKYLVVEK